MTPPALRLLVVEDTPDDAELLVREVRRTWPAVEWRRVEEREELEAALDEGGWDAVVADYTLPRLDAPTSLRLVRERGLDLPFIVVSGTVAEEDTVAAMRAGAHDYVMKGNLRRLGPALERELGEARRRARSRTAERRLAEAQELYSRVVRQLPGFVWTTDRGLRVTSSGGGKALTPVLPHDAAVGSSVDELASSIPLFDPERHRLALEGAHVVFESAWAGRDYVVQLEPFLDPAGRAEGCIGVALDLTERRAAEQALRESEARFRALIENSLDVTTILLADGTIRYASPSAERVLGFAPEELVGGSAFDFVHPDDEARLGEVFRQAVGSATPTRVASYRARHRAGGWRLMEAVGLNLLADPAVRGVVVTSRDITQRRALEERLSQSERLEAIGQLAGGVAHDFNNVLLVIRGYSTVLRAELTDPQQVADVDEITKAADRAANLTRQLLAFGRRQVLQPRVLAVSEVVNDLESLLRRVIPERIEVRLELDDEAPPVVADPAQIEQVLLNLVVNSRDAMPEGGRIVVRTGGVELDAPDDSATPPLAPGRYATLSVLDSGSGIPDEALPHIFEPFFTTKEEGVGTGLGLSTVYGIVAQSGGSVDVRTVVGRGTTITLFLPAAEAGELPEERPSSSRAGTPANGSESVLLVEDETQVRELVERVLADAGYRVRAAALPSEALELLGAADGFDLLLSDVVMPEMSGYELAERVLRERPRIRTLFISGYSPDAAEGERRLAHEPLLLQKPFTADALTRAVRAALDRERAAVG